jgi:hypothetical protein
MRRTFRTILVVVLVLSLSVDSATACRFLSRGSCYYQQCMSVCYEPCYPACYEPCYMSSAGMVCEQPCEPCCSSEVIESAPQTALPSEESLTAPEPPADSTPTPATVNKPPKPELPAVEAPEPGLSEEVPLAPQSDEWRATSEAPQLPAEPSDSLFDTQPEEPVMPNDSMSDETPAAEPAEPAVEPAPPATESEPAATEPAPAATPPAEQPSDDLFGPSSESETSTPAETGDDLFGAGPSDPADSEQPAAPAAEEPASDLFDTSSDEASAPADEGTSGGTESSSEQPPADDAAPAEESTPPAEDQKDDADDLFGGFGAILREPGGLASDTTRKWVDNTGRYSCHGRMIQFKDGQVRLLKDNGRTATVPIYRLSQGDLEFVYRQASAQRADVFGRTASTDR